MRQKTLFIADDGSEWETPEEAKARDAVVARGSEIDEWLTAREVGVKKSVEYKRLITDWLSK